MSFPATTGVPEERDFSKATAGQSGYAKGPVRSTIGYLMRTEVHTFAFSVAANAILSFFPFMMLLMTLVRRVFHSQVMYEVVVNLLRDSLPAGQEMDCRGVIGDTLRRM